MTDIKTALVTIPAELAEERIDIALAKLTGLSRTAITNALNQNQITTNGEPVAKSARAQAGQVFEVSIPKPGINNFDYSQTAPAGADGTKAYVSSLPKIVFEDQDLVVIDKPVGMAAHPSPGWTGPTVTGALQAMGLQISTSGAEERKGIVHRLDVGTSGLMVIAKSEPAYANLKDQFRNRTVHKIYHALVQGHLDPTVGTIDAPIDRHPKEDYRFAVVADGKTAITHYKTLEIFPAVTLVEVELETGRTHQIRVHFSALRHPLVADLIYGADPVLAKKLQMARPWLHAKKLGLKHPQTGAMLNYEIEYPADLANCLKLLAR
jgi:23S rRNA pseudouridine1911/1915/1917 synthase